MSRRGAMWPTELSGEPNFIDLTALAQWLFKLLWLHPDLDSGGFIALQVEVWARASSHLTPDEVEGALDELIARGWVSVDDDTGELWVRPFIELDTSRKPNMFVSAMRAVQTRRSRTVRHEAWVVIDRLYQENPLKPPANDADEKAWKIHQNLIQQRDDAYEQLRAKMSKEPFPNHSRTFPEPFPNPSGVGEPVGVGEEARLGQKLCTRCGRHPVMQRGLCGACLGREL